MLSTLTRDGSRRLTKNRNRSGNVVEDIRGRGGTCEVSRDERTWVSPVTVPPPKREGGWVKAKAILVLFQRLYVFCYTGFAGLGLLT